MDNVKYITEVDYIDSSVDFELGDDELTFALQMRAEYIKVEGEKRTKLFSLDFWTDWHDWPIPPYDEDETSEDDIVEWFNENSLHDGIVKDDYPELWDVDFYDNDVPVVCFDREPKLEIESAISDIWNGEDYELESTPFWSENTDEEQFPSRKYTFESEVEIAGISYQFDYEVELSSMEQMKLFDMVCGQEEGDEWTYDDLVEKIMKVGKEKILNDTVDIDGDEVAVKSLDGIEEKLNNLTFELPDEVVESYNNYQD